MASADFCHGIRARLLDPQPIRLARDAPGQHGRSPRVRAAASAPHPPHLLRYPLMAMGFALSCKLTRISQPFMRFVSLGSELCLGLPSDPTSRWTPLPPASSFRHQDLQGTLTPKPLPMPGTHEAPCSKLQGIKVDFIISPHPNPLHRERELRFYPVASYGE